MQKSIQIMGPPLQQELNVTQENLRDLESEVKLPYVINDKVIMSPGVWNDFYYSPEEIKKAYDTTDWEDKEVRSLYTDHEDLRAREWVGEIKNVRMEGDSILADLYIVDKPTAIKLAYGAKMGVSPKVIGQNNEGSMVNFTFDNNSVVINPAIKTAYINNRQIQGDDKMSETQENVQAYEDVRKPYGDVDYADPGYRGDEARYPIDTEKHVRAAWSYINQPDNREPYTEEQLKKIEQRIIRAAKDYGIEISEEAKNADNEAKSNEEEVNMTGETQTQTDGNEMSQELQEYMDFVKDYMSKNPDKSMTDAAQAWDKKKESESIEMSDVMQTLKELREEINSLKSAQSSNSEEEEGQGNQENNNQTQENSSVKEHAEKIAELSDVSVSKVMDALGPLMGENGSSQENSEEEEGEGNQETQGQETQSNEDNGEGDNNGGEGTDKKDEQINELQKKVQELQEKLNEPGESPTMKTTQEMSQEDNRDIDEKIMSHLQNLENGA